MANIDRILDALGTAKAAAHDLESERMGALATIDVDSTQITALNLEIVELKAQVQALEAELAAVTPQPATHPSEEELVAQFDFVTAAESKVLPAGLFLAGTGAVTYSSAGAGFHTQPGAMRCEVGHKKPGVAAVLPEPEGRWRQYKLAFMVPEAVVLGPHKTNVAQFWQKEGEEPVLAFEVLDAGAGSIMRVVQNIKPVGRVVLESLPIATGVWQDLRIRAVWSASALGEVRWSRNGGSEGMVQGPSMYPLAGAVPAPPIFKWGAYTPDYASSTPKAPAPAFGVVFADVEVRQSKST